MQISNSKHFVVQNDPTRFNVYQNEITPFKFSEWKNINLNYQIPPSSRFQVSRLNSREGAPDITYYFTTPGVKNYPIAILCEGSSNKDSLLSVIHFHRYFLEEFLNLKVGVLTLEQ